MNGKGLGKTYRLEGVPIPVEKEVLEEVLISNEEFARELVAAHIRKWEARLREINEKERKGLELDFFDKAERLALARRLRNAKEALKEGWA